MISKNNLQRRFTDWTGKKSVFNCIKWVFFKQDSGADFFSLYLIHIVSQDDTWLRWATYYVKIVIALKCFTNLTIGNYMGNFVTFDSHMYCPSLRGSHCSFINFRGHQLLCILVEIAFLRVCKFVLDDDYYLYVNLCFIWGQIM